MSRIQAKDINDIGGLKQMMTAGAGVMGFMPTDGLIMAHCPDMLKSSGAMLNSILSGGTVDAGLKRMMGYLTSRANGCQYCSAHTSFTALKNGISEDKMKALWDFKESDLFSEKERAALQLAVHAGMLPNQCSDEDFEQLKLHFSTVEIVELVFTLSVYAFLNKFNHTIKTTIEEEPLLAYQTINQQA